MALDLPQDRIARRIRWYRERRGLTQEQLASALGFSDRQTLAALEAGERRVTATELARAAMALDVAVETFLDPFRLVGEGEFSFRASDSATDDIIDAFAERAGRWIATYRELGHQSAKKPNPLSYKLNLRRDSSFEDAQASAEALWAQWKLGAVPAARLQDAVTRELGVLVLYVDAPKGISGAASQLPGVATILVNRRESEGRRNYDLAHELFHVLTWDAMPPERIEPQEVKPVKGNRSEQLANNFAAALLMPEPVMTGRWQRRGEVNIVDWVVATALEMKVSASALQWRLVNLRMIARSAMKVIAEKLEGSSAAPLLFSRALIERVHHAVEDGRLSLRRAAVLLDLSLDAFAELCRSYDLPLSYDMPAQV